MTGGDLPGARRDADSTVDLDGLPALRREHPAWRIWVSDEGRLHAVRPIAVAKLSTAVTVHADIAAGLCKQIAEADATQMAAHAQPPAAHQGGES